MDGAHTVVGPLGQVLGGVVEVRVAHEVRGCCELRQHEQLFRGDRRTGEHLQRLVVHDYLPIASLRSGVPGLRRDQTAPDTPTTRDETYPLAALPVIDGVCVETPSENTMSELSDPRDRLLALNS